MNSLKNSLCSSVRCEQGTVLVGIARPDDFTLEEINGIAALIDSFSRAAPLPEELKKIAHPREVLPGARSIIVWALPDYITRPLGFTACRQDLLGTASALHVSAPFRQQVKQQAARVISFFTGRGFACRDLAGTLFPLKIAASRCGIGFYGKNSMIIHPEYGSWLYLAGCITDALLEPDDPLAGTCGDCSLCVRACPVQALHTPYRCDETRCVNFHLGHNKKSIPVPIRSACRNLIGQACTVCKDVCPRNRGLKPLPGLQAPPELLNPSLEGILAMDEAAWQKTFGSTLLGMTMRDRKYMQRNAAVALGNFRDTRAVPALARQLTGGADEVKEYAAWALGRIGSPPARQQLSTVLKEEQTPHLQQALLDALNGGSEKKDRSAHSIQKSGDAS